MNDLTDKEKELIILLRAAEASRAIWDRKMDEHSLRVKAIWDEAAAPFGGMAGLRKNPTAFYAAQSKACEGPLDVHPEYTSDSNKLHEALAAFPQVKGMLESVNDDLND